MTNMQPGTGVGYARRIQLGSSMITPVRIDAQRPLTVGRLDNLSARRTRIRNACNATTTTVHHGVSGAKPAPSVHPSVLPSKLVWNSPSGQHQQSGLFHKPLSGHPEPLGASIDATTGAVNFAITSSNATGVALVLFTETDLRNGRTTCEVPLDPVSNRTGDVWHIMLPDLKPDLLYGYRMRGDHQDVQTGSAGNRFNESKVLLDPYATAILSRRQYGQLGSALPYGSPDVLGLATTWPQHAAALPPPLDDFDWEGDRPLHTPMEQLVIYEMHVRGFTAHPSTPSTPAAGHGHAHAGSRTGSSSSGPLRGTYAAMVSHLDYLVSLGVNAVELMPVQEFNELEYYGPIPGSPTGEHRLNFWGYSTLGFFAPMSRYSDAVARGQGARGLAHEFKALVKECHRRGIEVIMDVVFNHTAEGNEKGPTLSFRGLDNRLYYMLAPGGEYYNYSGCGNTLNCNHPVVRRFITDCLKFWVTEYHVDGFRFDLGSILTRSPSWWHTHTYDAQGKKVPLHSDGAAAAAAAPAAASGILSDACGVPTGTPLADPPLIETLSEDPVLRHTKLIAEAWDCDGLNQVGGFPHYGGRWSEWNGGFRDSVRQFIKGSDGWAGKFASALCGSPHVYAEANAPEADWWGSGPGRKWRGGRGPTASVNFVTAHDGFTLADLVAYNEKHNEANGEGNRDGESHNLSWNCGEEGDTGKWGVKRLRSRQQRNLGLALLLAHGVPMLVMGDEYGHSKGGNNNTYCHDSPLNWFNWEMAKKDEGGFARFMRSLIHFRRRRSELQRATYVSDTDIQWHGDAPNTPDWSDTSRLVAYTLRGSGGVGGLYVAFNASHLPRILTLPAWPGRCWLPVVDTGKLAPYDFLAEDEVLSADEVMRARGASLMWTADSTYPLMPWSACVLESVAEGEAAAAAQGAAAGAATPLHHRGKAGNASKSTPPQVSTSHPGSTQGPSPHAPTPTSAASPTFASGSTSAPSTPSSSASSTPSQAAASSRSPTMATSSPLPPAATAKASVIAPPRGAATH